MTKKVTILITAVLIVMSLVSCLIVWAADDVTLIVSYDTKNSELDLTGTTYGETAITIFHADANPSDGALPIYVKQFTAYGDYAVAVKLPANTSSGKYKAYVTSENGEANDSFNYINIQIAGETLELINAAQSAADVQSICEQNAVNIGIDISDSLYEENKEEIYKLLFSQNIKYADVSEFNNAYYKMYALAAINGADNQLVQSILAKYYKYLEIDYQNDIIKDERLSDKGRETLYRLLSATDYISDFIKSGTSDFVSVLNELKPVAALDSAAGWVDIKDAFENDFDELKELLDNKTYKSIIDKDSVYSELMNYEYSDYSDIESAFLKAITSIYKKENKSSDGSGKGGSSPGGGSTYQPVVTPSDVQESFEQSNKIAFNDLDENHWAYEVVNSLSSKGVINGYEDNTFRPDNTVTRAEFIKLITKGEEILGSTANTKSDASIQFSDVSESDWYHDIVIYSAQNGYITGSDGYFRPNDEITRQDAAVIIYRFVSSMQTLGGNKVFNDRSDISDYARESVSRLAASGIISGVGNNMFDPLNSLTRAQAAQLVYNVVEFIK